MKRILVMVLLVLSIYASAYEYEIGQKLPTVLTYSCDDPVLEDAFKRMFAIWNFACDGIFSISKGDSSATIIVFLGTPLFPHRAAETMPLGDKATICFVTPLRLTGETLDAVMLHEIGHALGMDHSTDLHAIMNPEPLKHSTLDQDDVDGIREFYGLSPKQFDFELKVKGNGFSAKCPYGKANWENQYFEFLHRRAIRWNFHTEESFEVEMIYNGISVYRKVTRLSPRIKHQNQ